MGFTTRRPEEPYTTSVRTVLWEPGRVTAPATRAHDGAQAFEMAVSERPDALVLDKVMPKLDGFEVVRMLREREETRTVPIVMLTEHSNEEDVLSGLTLGVDEYMPKPFSPRELSLRLDRLLARGDPGR